MPAKRDVFYGGTSTRLDQLEAWTVMQCAASTFFVVPLLPLATTGYAVCYVNLAL